MVDPVVAADGHTYERDAIEQWYRTRRARPPVLSPATHEPVRDLSLRLKVSAAATLVRTR